ncbi:MAG: hypothetical protein DRO11_09240 [Methanobacteriota archaeon]|nr:MAG: hypothetical protein DRO11_09240 [Euryarchaeota archaeon]
MWGIVERLFRGSVEHIADIRSFPMGNLGGGAKHCSRMSAVRRRAVTHIFMSLLSFFQYFWYKEYCIVGHLLYNHRRARVPTL